MHLIERHHQILIGPRALTWAGRREMKKAAGLIVVLAMSSQSALAIGPLNIGIHPDLSVVGPGGEVIIYYKDPTDSSYIIVKNCGSNYPVIKTRSDCQGGGPENKVPVEVFKRALKSEFLLGDADKLKPLTPAEVKSYRQHDASGVDALTQQQQTLKAHLDKIAAFIKQYGADSQTNQDDESTRALLADVQTQLTSTHGSAAAAQKVNTMINDLVNKITSPDYKDANGNIPSVSSARNSDQAAYTILKQFDASKAECGTDEILNGTYDNPNGTPDKAGKAAWLEKLWVSEAVASVPGGLGARMKNCAQLPKSSVSYTNSSTGQTTIWKLIARQRDPHTGEFHEVWQDSHTLKLWGDTLDGTYTHYNAVELDATGKRVVGEKACAPTNDKDQAAVAKSANAGVDDKSWGLPTIKEFQQANDDGITQVLPNMSHWFWSSSLNPDNADDAQLFYGNWSSLNYRRYDDDSVRCVGR